MLFQKTQEPVGAVGYLQYLPLVFILAIFYLIVFLPARRRQKKLDDMLNNLKPGDKVITNGGIYGTIVTSKADRLQLRVAETVKIEISRNAIAALQKPEEE